VRRLLPLALLALAACIDDLAPQYRVVDLRILAVRASVEGETSAGGATFADPSPGDALSLQALVANPLGRGSLAVTWYACLPSGTDAAAPCLDERTLREPGTLAALAATPGSGVLALGAGESVSVPIPAASDPTVGGALEALVQRALAQPTYACGLYAEIPVVAVAEAEGRRETAVKRVRVTPDPATLDPLLADAYVRNANPAIFEIRGGASEEACASGWALGPASFPGERIFLCGAVSAGAQPFNACGPAGERISIPESLSWQWYVTAGEFPEVGGVGNATGSAPEFERPAGAFTLWVVLRDGRGGEGWLTLDVLAPPP
jgi:hypothetical protein